MSFRLPHRLDLCLCAPLFLSACSTLPEPPPSLPAPPAAWNAPAARLDPSAATAAAVDLPQSSLFSDSGFLFLQSKALESSPSLTLALASLREARAQAALARSALYPRDSIQAGATQSEIFNLDRNAAWVPSWEIHLLGSELLDSKAAALASEAREADVAGARLALLSELAGSYLSWRHVLAEIPLADAEIASLSASLSAAESSREAGTAPIFPSETAKIALLDAKNRRSALLSETALAREALRRLSGASSLDLDGLSGSPDAPLPSVAAPSAPAIPAEALLSRPDLASAELSLRSALTGAQAAEARRYPKITLSGVISLFSPTAPAWSAAALLSYPLLSQFSLKAEAELAESRAEIAAAQFSLALARAVEESESALEAQEASAYSARIARARSESSALSLRAAEALHSAGSSATPEIESARIASIASRRAHLRALLGESQASVALIKALGGPWPSSPESAP